MFELLRHHKMVRVDAILVQLYSKHNKFRTCRFSDQTIANFAGRMPSSEVNLGGACSEIIDDIEDLISSQDIQPKQRYANKKDVVIRAKKKDPSEGKAAVVQKTIHESVVPGSQTIYLKTWGCAHNNSDSEYMAGWSKLIPIPEVS